MTVIWSREQRPKAQSLAIQLRPSFQKKFASQLIKLAKVSQRSVYCNFYPVYMNKMGGKAPPSFDQEIAEFLESHPDLSRQLQRLQDTRFAVGEQETARTLLQKAVTSELTQSTTNSIPRWMSHLIKFNYKDNDIDDIDFVTTLLFSHLTEKPWIIEAPFVEAVARTLEQSKGVYPKPPYSIEPSPIQRLVEAKSEGGDPPKTLIYPPKKDPPQSKRAEHDAFDVDCHLGVAGALPINVPTPRFKWLLGSKANSRAAKEAFLEEFRYLVSLEPLSGDGVTATYRARVRFLSKKDTMLKNAKKKLTNRISAMIQQLRRTIIHLQKEGKLVDRIPYVSFASEGGRAHLLREGRSGRVDMASAFAVRSIYIPTVLGYFDTLEELLSLASSSFFAQLFNGGERRVVMLWDRATIAAREIFRDLLEPELEMRRHDFWIRDPVMLDLLKKAALIVQFISLAIQSRIRGCTCPMEFDFLEHGIEQFILEGPGFGNDELVACAGSLTCLGDMIQQKVLVFGVGLHEVSGKYDLIASLEDVLSIWGPGELELHHTKSSPTSNKEHLIAQVHIGGGILRQSTSSTIRRLHWQGDEATSNTQPNPGLVMAPFELLGQFRIGAAPQSDNAVLPHTNDKIPTFGAAAIAVTATSRLKRSVNPRTENEFMPVGPVTRPHECEHTKRGSERDRRNMTEHRQNALGTHPEYYQMAGHDFSFQGGQYAVGQYIQRWDRVKEKSKKEVMTEESNGVTEVLKSLDRYYGLFISSSTNFMTRARLRDIVAFAGPILCPEKFPLLKEMSKDQSIEAITSALRGQALPKHWKLFLEGNTTRLSDSNELKELVISVLKRLKDTGVMPYHRFDVAWISPSSEESIVISEPLSHAPWLTILRDNQGMATYACVTPGCLDACQGTTNDCKLNDCLKTYTLSTRIQATGERSRNGKHKKLENFDLELGRAYIHKINDLSAIVGTVTGDDPESCEIQLSVSSMKWHLKRLIMRRDIRYMQEVVNGTTGKPCRLRHET